MTEIVSNKILVLNNSTALQVVRLADFLAIFSRAGEDEADKCEIWAF
ncbi:hypothetical protein [Sphingobacterium sp. HMA12]|jgi:hypothetical protein|nr:hypothetical protein [Sphingobacterium sp. HMA12]